MYHMDIPKISVIIPIYGVEEYLDRSIKSVLNQSVQDIEIVLVDDGSPDNCPQICDEYAAIDSRVVVLHKENGGLSSARNAGVGVARGEFILYLDADDYLSHNAVEKLMTAQVSYDSDVVVGGYSYTYTDHETVAQTRFSNITILQPQEAVEALVSGKIQNFAWGKLIKSELAKRHRFPEGKLFEDVYWTHYIFDAANSVTVITEPIVHYVQRSNSISYSYSLKRLDVLEGWEERRKFLSKKYPELEPLWLERISTQLIEMAWLVLTKMKKDKIVAFNAIRRYLGEKGIIENVPKDKQLLLQALKKAGFFMLSPQ